MRLMWQLPLVCSSFLFVSACSWFGGEKEVEPNKLVDFEKEVEFERLWSNSIGELGRKYRQLSAATDDKNVYVTDANGQVHAFDKINGDELWALDLDETVSSGVGVGNAGVALALESGDVVLIDSLTGAQVWRVPVHAEVLAQPQFNESIVVVQSIDGKLTALHLETGNVAWVFDAQVPSLTLRGTSAPIVTANVTFAGFANGKVTAIDNSNGNEGWSRQVAIPSGRSALERIVDLDGRMILTDGVLYASSYQGRLAAINPYNAQLLWAKKISSFRGLASGYGNVYVTDANDAIQAFDLKTSASVWRQPQLSYRAVGAPVVAGDSVVVADKLGYLHALSQVDGRFVGRYHVDSSGITADMTVSEDVIYVISKSGRLEALTVN